MKMRALLALPLLFLFTAGALAGTKSGTFEDTLDMLMHGSESGGLLCYSGEPRSLPGYRERADAIVRVRLDAASIGKVPFDSSIEQWVLHDATVLEVFKSSPDIASGARISISEWRGDDAPRSGLLTRFFLLFDPLRERTEWIVFLQSQPWRHGYSVVHHEEGAFQIRDGLIVMRSHSPWAMQWRGQRVEVLERALN
jgi:hypothetical protein